jgi:hypothetical protein
MVTVRVTGLALLLALGPRCASPKGPAVALGDSSQSAWQVPGTSDYRDSTSWHAAWDGMYPIPGFRPALPAIDFSHRHVVIVAAGVQPSGGYRLVLDSSAVRRDTSQVFVTLQTPAPGCGVTQELTAPALAIGLPARPAPFRIITHQRTGTTRCP